MDSIQELALTFHKEFHGKIGMCSKVEVNTPKDLSLAYTPGVAEPCKAIAKDPDASYEYTSRGNLVAMISDGTAVLGLGDIGAGASMPVIEGKSLLYKKFAGVDAFPIALQTKDVDEIVNIIKALEPTFGGIHLEDISAPRCFEIEDRLKREVNIPIYHDDQHGTAVVVLAGLINALKIVKKDIEDVKIVVAGAGASGIAIIKLLLNAGAKNIIAVDKEGILCTKEPWMNSAQESIAEVINTENTRGTLTDAVKDSDVFVGVSTSDVLNKDMVALMNADSIVFALANPVPEIFPEDALEAGAKIVATGRSDYPNQVNNLLAFPGIFRGALDVRAKDINIDMKLAAAHAIAEIVSEKELNENYIIPDAFNEKVVEMVSEAVAKKAIETGISRIKK